MNAVREEALKLIEKELADANTKFPPFSSPHEGYAVLKEEFEECFDELVNAKGHLECVWQDIKKNTTPSLPIALLRKDAIALVVEAVQLAAMCDKFDNSMGLAKEITTVLEKERERIANGRTRIGETRNT